MNKKVILILLGLIFLNVSFGLYALNLNKPLLEVVFFDIGQGDSIFIESSLGHQILLDGGPGSLILEKLEKEMAVFDRDLDLIILSHPDSDHLSGLVEVLKKYKVKNILQTGALKDSDLFYEWAELVSLEGANIYFAKAGKKISFSDDEFLEIIYPSESLADKRFSDMNETSLVFKYVFGETSFLFGGDISKKTELSLLGGNLDSDVLKISHHGSRDSTCEEFLRAVSPKVAVVSCGLDNPYGHPHAETLELLNKYGINIFRTDQKGDIKLLSDKNKIYGVSGI